MAKPLTGLARLLLGATLSFWLVGCASYTDETRSIRTLYRSGNFQKALEDIEASSIRGQSKNRLLYRLEKAMILDRLGERQKSRTLLLQADKIADELYTVSISKTAASFVVNDATTDYSGEDYEKVAIHTQLALSFLEDGKLQSALVEARKINNKLHEINQQYEDQKNRYGEDAFARYLAGLIHEAGGNADDAIIDYAKALKLYEGVYKRYSGGVADGLVGALYRLYRQRGRTARAAKLAKDYPKVISSLQRTSRSQTGELVIIHELGHIATKTTGEFFITVGGQVVRFSFPVIKPSGPGSFGKTGVLIEGQKRFVAGERVQDMDAIARDTLEDKRLRTIAKQTARLLVKGQLTEQAYKNFGLLGGIAANVYSVVSETADTRSWTLLPQAYYITRVRLPPGAHDIQVRTAGRTDVERVHIRPGRIIILRDVG